MDGLYFRRFCNNNLSSEKSAIKAITKNIIDNNSYITTSKSSRRIAFGAIAVALTAVCAQISIPLPPIPWTLQTFAVLLCGAVLGSRVGAYGLAAYLFVGLIGVPVFSGLKGGPQMILSPSFGYIIAFPFAAMVAGLFGRGKSGLSRSPLPLLMALIPIYIIGPAYLYFIAPIALGKRLPLSGVAAVGIIPFILPDIVKAFLAWALAGRLKGFLRKDRTGK